MIVYSTEQTTRKKICSKTSTKTLKNRIKYNCYPASMVFRFFFSKIIIAVAKYHYMLLWIFFGQCVKTNTFRYNPWLITMTLLFCIHLYNRGRLIISNWTTIPYETWMTRNVWKPEIDDLNKIFRVLQFNRRDTSWTRFQRQCKKKYK